MLIQCMVIVIWIFIEEQNYIHNIFSKQTCLSYFSYMSSKYTMFSKLLNLYLGFFSVNDTSLALFRIYENRYFYILLISPNSVGEHNRICICEKLKYLLWNYTKGYPFKKYIIICQRSSFWFCLSYLAALSLVHTVRLLKIHGIVSCCPNSSIYFSNEQIQTMKVTFLMVIFFLRR